MSENNDTQNLEAPPPPTTPPPTEPPTEPPTGQPAVTEAPEKRWRERRVGVVTLAAVSAGALLIGGTLGAVSGAAVGYGVGHHDHPDRPALVQRQDQPQGGMPGGGMPGQRLVPPNGQLPPGTAPEDSEGSDESESSNS